MIELFFRVAEVLALVCFASCLFALVTSIVVNFIEWILE